MVLRNDEIKIGGCDEALMWFEQRRIIKDERRIVLKICYSSRPMWKLCSMTKANLIAPISFADMPISLLQLQVGVQSFAPVLKQFWRLADLNWKKV